MATYSDFTQLNSLADIASASGYGDKKIISVVDSGAIKFYEVGPVDLGAGIEMLDGKFANLKSAGDSATVSFADITGQPSDNAALAADLNSKKSLTTKTTANTGELPNWAAWIADTSTSALTRPMPTSPSDGEEVTIRDGGNNAETNNITPTVTPPTTIPEGALNVNGQSKKFRYDASGDTWDLVFSDAPASGGGETYEVQEKVLYISNGLVSETDTGAKLSVDQSVAVDIATYLGSDWVGEELYVKLDVFNDTGSGTQGWGNPEWIYNTGGLGVNAEEFGNEIIVQSGDINVSNTTATAQGHPFGNLSSAFNGAKVRLTIVRLTYNNSQGLGNLVDVHTIDVGNITNNTRNSYDISTEIGPSWDGADIFTKCQVQYNSKWGDPRWAYDGGAQGVRSDQLGSDSIVVQSGAQYVLASNGNAAGHPFGNVGSPQTSLPCRVKCYKLKDAAVAAGVVGSTSFSLGTISTSSRTVTPISSLPSDFLGKTLLTKNEVQIATIWGDPEWVYQTSGRGIRSNTLGDDVITQSGNSAVTTASSSSGNPHGNTSSPTSLPSRFKAWRFG